MTRIPALSILTLLFGLFGRAATSEAAPKQPVYIYLYSRNTDHVNIEVSEDRLHRTAPLAQRYRRLRPEFKASATVLLSGSLTQALSDRNPKSGIKDFVLEYVRNGSIEIGYDGTDEPTYQRRARADLPKANTSEERWTLRFDAAEKFLTEARDLSGLLLPGIAGGLKRTQEVFGEVACITGVTEELGGDSEYVHAITRHTTKAIMFGVPDPDPARNIHGYRPSAESFGYQMAPLPLSSPELNWQDNVLRSSETSDSAIRLVLGQEGPEALKAVLEKMDRSHVRIVHVELASPKAYFQPGFDPPLKYAYNHPENPRLREYAWRKLEEVDAAYFREEALMKWVVEEFFPANPGSRFVSSRDLREMTTPSVGFSVPMAALVKAVDDLVKLLGNDTYLVNYVRAGEHYLSLADLFVALANALAEKHLTGKLPDSVRVTKIYGPVETHGYRGPAHGEVTAGAVAKVCSGLVDRLNDQTWQTMPNNMVPSWVTIDGKRLPGSQFLRLMAEALIAPSRGTALKLKMTHMFSAAGEIYPKTRLRSDQGATWTFKPAALSVANP